MAHGTRHPKYVRGCPTCLERSRAGSRRLTESRARAAAEVKARAPIVQSLGGGSTRTVAAVQKPWACPEGES